MNVVDALFVLSRWIHIGAAIVAVGGTVFQRFILHPALAAIAEGERAALRARVLGRWRIAVHSSIALLLISGIANAVRAFGLHRGQGLYHGLFGVKVLAALAIFGLAAVLTGRSARAQKMRERAPFWLTVLVLLAGVVVCLSGVLKFVPATS